jgi:LysM repeat protein
MTSRRHWSILIALLLMLSLFLVACERPLPGDNEAVSTATPAETDFTETYPGPPAPDSEDTIESYPAGESYPPAEESESSTEGYPASEGETIEDESAEGETTEGEAVEGETTEGEAAEGETAEGETTEGEAVEDETTEGGAAEGETTEGEAAESSDETQAVESGRTHTVASGENLFRIGMQYGMSWVTLAQANGLTNPNSLYVGQVLVIPDIETIEDTEVSAEETETEETESEAVEAEAPTAIGESEISAEGEVLTVYVGPELIECVGVAPQNCMQVKTSPDHDYTLFYDQIEGFEFEPGYEYELLVLVEPVDNPPADASTLKYSLVEEVSKTPTSTEGSVETEEMTYVVQGGDTLYAISYRFGVSMMEIARENELVNFNQIYAGQELVIPEAETEEEDSESTTSEGTEGSHVVEEGETVFTIAFQYGISWTKLVDANEIPSPYSLEVGQTLIVPPSE